MRGRSLLLPLAALALLSAGGCNSQPQGEAISKQDESRMKAPPGSNPMPPEARAAMERAKQGQGGPPASAPPGPGGGR